MRLRPDVVIELVNSLAMDLGLPSDILAVMKCRYPIAAVT
jgi:hypothetical protein